MAAKGRPIFQMPDIHKKCCQLLVENIHVTTISELPTEKIVANMLATEVWLTLDTPSVRYVRREMRVFTLIYTNMQVWNVLTTIHHFH